MVKIPNLCLYISFHIKLTVKHYKPLINTLTDYSRTSVKMSAVFLPYFKEKYYKKQVLTILKETSIILQLTKGVFYSSTTSKL